MALSHEAKTRGHAQIKYSMGKITVDIMAKLTNYVAQRR